MRILNGLVLLNLFFSAFGIAGAGAETLLVGVKANGKTTQVPVPANSSADSLTVYFSSRGKISAALFAELTGPAGLAATVDAIKQKGSPKTVAQSAKKFVAVTMEPPLKVKRSAAATIARATVECTAEQLAALRQLSQQIPAWRNLSDAQLCEIANGNTSAVPGGGNGNGSAQPTPSVGERPGDVTSVGVLYKDTCANDKKYLVRVKIDLRKVAAEDLARGFEVGVALRDVVYGGKTAASVKESSDGKYGPNPLLLMSSMGCYSSGGKAGEKVYLMQWQGASIANIRTIDVKDCIGYKGQTYTRSLLSGLLNGGRGTFTLLNPTRYSAYSVCFNLARVRQRVNGYPG